MNSHMERISLPLNLKHYSSFHNQLELELGPALTFSQRERGSFSSTATGSDETHTTSEGPVTPLTSNSCFDRTTLDSSSFTSTPPRPPKSINRKLPPKLTESLENLSLVVKIPLSTAPDLWDLGEMYEYTVDKPLPITPKGSLELAARTAPAQALAAQRSMPSIRGPRSKRIAAPSNPSTRNILPPFLRAAYAESSGSSATSHNLVTPASSAPRASASICSEECSRFDETNWTLYNEVERADLDAAARKGKETRKERKQRKLAEEEAFDAETIPAMRDLHAAGNVEIVGEDGKSVRFGDLVKERRTIVVFIRHWFCPLCAQYMTSIISQVRPEALEEADVGLIIIGNGSGKMLPAYKNKAFKCPFPMYTDPSLALYRALGLTRQTADAGPDEDAGDYLVQTAFQSTISTLKRATVMPLKNPGHFFQLGGEFIFDGALNCTYTHRMTTTRDHAPIRDVCREAGVRLEWVHYEPGEAPPPVHRGSFGSGDVDVFGSDVTPPEMADESVRASPDLRWKADRNDEIKRIRKLKKARRSGARFSQVKVVENGESDEMEETARRLVGLGLE